MANVEQTYQRRLNQIEDAMTEIIRLIHESRGVTEHGRNEFYKAMEDAHDALTWGEWAVREDTSPHGRRSALRVDRRTGKIIRRI